MSDIKYEVVVGNIGSVYSGDSLELAKTDFNEYVNQSESGYGRAANEPVTLFEDGEIIKEYTPCCASCVGCKWLYQEGAGYSNYTWEEDYVQCAQNRNENLANGGREAPCDWNNETPEEDNWPMTNQSRCELYSLGPYVTLDVDGEDGPADYTDDENQIEIICKHSGRERNGN